MYYAKRAIALIALGLTLGGGLAIWDQGQWRMGQASTGTTTLCELAGGHIMDVGPFAYHCAADATTAPTTAPITVYSAQLPYNSTTCEANLTNEPAACAG